MKLLRSLLLGTVSLLAASATLAAPPLLAPSELNALLKSPAVRVIDIRDPKAYAEKRIPGAVSAPYGEWRGPAANPGELPELPKLTALVQRLGLTPATHAVVVSSGADTTDFGAAARVYWTLKVLGLKELSVLNGGVKAWAQANLPQDAVAVNVAASSFAPSIDKSLIATRDEVKAQIESGKGRLVDSRPADFFNGDTRHQAAKLPGTLKGALNLEHSRWFAPGSSNLAAPEEIRRIAATLPAASADTDTVSFCNTGHWAATNWFALSEVAGQKNVKLYAGSMVEWTQSPLAALMDNIPSRAKQLAIDARLWAERTVK
jgi:thiosulfate/3-mercaptopyruvate sulfurtransferase